MPSQQNIDQVNDLKEKLENSKAVILTDYSGLSASDQVELRQRISEAKGQLLIAKNRLFKHALKELNKEISQDLEAALEGPTAFLFAADDEIAPIKALVSFAQEKDLPKTKIGILLKPSDRVLFLEEINALAVLPSKDQLVAKLIGTLNSPTYRLVNVLSGNIRKLALIIKEIQKQKESN